MQTFLWPFNPQLAPEMLYLIESNRNQDFSPEFISIHLAKEIILVEETDPSRSCNGAGRRGSPGPAVTLPPRLLPSAGLCCEIFWWDGAGWSPGMGSSMKLPWGFCSATGLEHLRTRDCASGSPRGHFKTRSCLVTRHRHSDWTES